MIFGLRNEEQTFQKCLDNVTNGLNFCYAYVDNISVFLQSFENYEKHLWIVLVFQLFSDSGIIIISQKCVFHAFEVLLLGYLVSMASTRSSLERVSTLRQYAVLQTIRVFCRFLAMVNVYRHLLPHGVDLWTQLHAIINASNIKNPNLQN